MALREKTKRRLKWTVIVAVALACAAGGAYALRLRQLERRAVAKRAQGVTQLAAGDYYNALHNIGAYVQRHPTDAEALFQYATARKHVEEPNGKHVVDAIRFYRRVLDLEPGHAQASDALLELYAGAGYDTEALTLADAVLRRDAKHAAALTTKVTSLARLRRFDQALDVARKYAQARPLELDAHVLVLGLMQKCDRPAAELIGYAEELRKRYPDNPTFALLQSVTYHAAGDVPQATTWARTAASSTTKDPTFILAASRQLDTLGLYGESLELVRRSVQPDSEVRLKRMLARRLLQSKAYAELLDVIQPQWHGEDAELVATRAIALARLGRNGDAEAIAATLAKRNGEAAVAAWVDVVNAASRGESIDARERIRTLSAALKHHPDNAYVCYLLGDAHLAANEHDAAAQNWQRARALAPAWSEPLDRRARLGTRLGRTEEAVAAARAACERAPRDIEPKVGLALALAGAARTGQPNALPELLKLVNEIHAQRPNEELTLPIRVQLLARHGDRPAAEAALRDVLAVDPAPSEAALLQLSVVSRELKLGFDDACLDRSEKAHGLTPNLALTRARLLRDAGRPQDGLALLDAARKQHRAGKESDWGIAWGWYLDQSGDARAHDEWVALADRFPQETNLQWLAIASPSVQGDREFVGRILERLKGQVGESALTWRLKRAQWLLGSKSNNKDTVEAALLLNEVSRGSPDLLAPRLMLANAFEKLGNTSGAIEQLSVAANLEPGSNEIALELARLLQSRGDFVQARGHIDRVVQNNTATPVQRRAAAALLAQQGDTDVALELLEADINPADLPADRTLATIFRKRNEPAKVEAILRKLLEKPDVATIAFAADFYAAQNRRADADAVLARMDAITAEAGERHLARAEFFRRHGPTDHVVGEYQAAIKGSPQDAAPWRQLAIFHLTSNRPVEAAAAVSAAASALPGNPTFEAAKKHVASFAAAKDIPTLASLLVWLLENPTDEPAIADVLPAVTKAFTKDTPAAASATALRPLADRHPRLVPLQTLVAERYLTAGRPEEAVSLASRAARAAPNAPLPARLVAAALFAQRKWPEALAAAEQWRSRAGDRPIEADQMIAYVHLQMSNPAAAKAQLQPYIQQAIVQPDQFRPLILHYARTEVALGRSDAAAELLRPMLGRSAEWRLACMELSVHGERTATGSARWLQEVEGAIPVAAFRERLALTEAWQALAQRHHEFQPTARQWLSRIAQEVMVDQAAPALVSVACMQELQEDKPGAEVTYRRALELDPTLRIAQNNLAALLVRKQANLDEALQLATRASQGVHAHQPSFLDTLAAVQAARSEYDAAVHSIEGALRLQPDNILWHIRLADVLSKCGRTERAQAIVKQIESMSFDRQQLSDDARLRLESVRTRLGQGRAGLTTTSATTPSS